MVSIPGYYVNQQIYNGSRTHVYRSVRDSDQKPVVIKLLKNPYPNFNELLQFRNQYTIAKNLDISGIVIPYSLESYQNGYALVMEDFGGISLREYMQTRENSLVDVLSIGLQIIDILQKIHQQRVIHKDIKPDNILINPETKEIKLIDFSIASLLPKETQEIKNPHSLEGTLAYISPEQTGRMNRGIDYRSDFYALGVTLYELFSGELPFNSDDAMELVHCHIAKQPPEINKSLSNLSINKPHPNPLLGKEREQEIEEIPQVLSDIVMKLMAKNAEDRYQSALGLKHDLEICLNQFKSTGIIEEFEIGKKDICDRFLIPEKLYGREEEVKELLAAFERVSQGNRELMLVAGFSGIGKTAVVNEVHKPIVKQRGYFIKGKFDQFNRNIPLSAFVQAFRSLMTQLLSETDAQLLNWKNNILQALGDNGQVIIEVIPELEKILGKQPEVTELSGSAAQNRFNLLFEKFIQVFTTKEHPLVVFLDDLQWADSASLKLMQLLMSESSADYLLMIGAYRDNEVFPAHPLMLTLSDINQKQGTINTITLETLSETSLNTLVADTLNCSVEIALSLTKIIYVKTQGNPFFSTQFLKGLYQDDLIKFDFDTISWVCDISVIKSLALTDDVVEFMANQIQKLPESTQDILKLAACVGNQFDLDTLAVISEQSQIETSAALWRALQEGIVLPQNEVYKFYLGEEHSLNQIKDYISVNYKFLHDRVQQAAYYLIPEEQKKVTHAQIGRLLWKNTPSSQLQERIFAIANQLNIGIEYLQQASERHEVARLNLIAGKQAKASTAYSSAITYLRTGIQLLPSHPWQSDYNLTLSLYSEVTEACYLGGEFDAMEKFAHQILQNAKAVTDTAKIYGVKIEAYTVRGKLLAAIDIALEFLQKVGIEFPSIPTESDFYLALQETQTILSGKTVAQLADLPQMQNPEFQAALRILLEVATPAYHAKPQLHRLLILKEVYLCAKYGNIAASAFAYSTYGLMLCGQPDSIAIGYEFGQLALQLLSKYQDKEYEAKTLVIVHHFVTHWKEPATATLKPLLKAYTSGLDSGDLSYAGYGAYLYGFHAYISGQELTKLAQELAIYGSSLEKINQKTALNYTNIYHQSVLNLVESKSNPWELIGSAYNEQEMLTLHEKANDDTGLWHLFTSKLILSCLFQNYYLAVEYIRKAKKYSSSGYAMINISLLNFYDSLVQLTLFPNSSPQEQQEILQQVSENQQIMQKWAHHAPMNYQHKFDLVEAEKYRVLGQKLEAIELYEKAISGAKENGYIQEEGLANELQARFYLDWGKGNYAALHMQETYYCYARWGAKAKTDDLEKRYPQLLAPILQNQHQKFQTTQTTFESDSNSKFLSQTNQKTLTSCSNIDESLDFASILKACQTLSSEIKLERLICSLIQLVMENAGASKAALLLQKEDTLILEALANSNQDIERLNIRFQENDNIPHTVINLVKHNLNTIILDDVTAQNDFVTDSYLIQQNPKSLLCMPILNQGKLIGLLYLENNLSIGAFTENRVEILNVLTTQAAISLENAQLYSKISDYSHTLELKVEKRTQQLTEKATELESTLKDLQKTQAQLIQSEKMSALGKLVAGIAHEINNPISFIYGNLTPVEEYIESLIELFNFYQNNYHQYLPEIDTKIVDLDLDFIIDDLPKILNSMKIGAERICEIVLSLRNFSRLDESEIKSVDINSGIDSTLLILQHQLASNNKYPEIQIIKEYKDIPKVMCYASELNQVFMNIISNAIDALRDKQENKPRIKIRTSKLDYQNILISIADNGIGINQSILNKIFDPFFTTKPVGSGTGLGLSTSYSIVVEKHGGKLSCVSTPGEGTEFLIQLPLSH